MNVVTHTYFSRTAWTSIPEEFHLQAGANVSKHTQTHVNAALNQTERGIQFVGLLLVSYFTFLRNSFVEWKIKVARIRNVQTAETTEHL